MLYWERCSFCGTQVQYDPETMTYIKCTGCGQISHFTSFEREQKRIRAQIEAGEQAKAALEQARQEKLEAEKRLGDAVSALAGIQSSQEAGRQALDQLLEGQAVGREGQAAVTALLQATRQESREGQDALNRLLQSAIRNQKTGEDKLTALQGLARDILRSQGKESALMEACNRRLEAGQGEMKALIREMSQWNQQTHQESKKRLEAIVQASDALQSSVEKIDGKVDALRRKADETRAAIAGFRGAWEQDKRNELTELYHRANNSRKDQRFDDAIREYRDVLVKGGKDAEVYWRIVLCHYCVVYQQDDEEKFIPTLLNPDLTDPGEITARQELERCISGTPVEAHYHQMLADIDRVLDRYRQVKDQMQYDVFISVKQSFENHRTTDSDIASDLYDHLTGLGLRVFNSRRCKKNIPLGRDAEPYIISALLSSRVLIVVGTSRNFMNAQWVRNEWSRFQWLMKKEAQRTGKSQRELFCYLSRDMSPYDIPRGLNPSRQAVIDSGDAYEIIDREMRRIFSQLQPAYPQPQPVYPQPQPVPTSGASKLTVMKVNLMYGNFDTVLKIHEEGLFSGTGDLTDVRFHLYALCAKYKVKNIQALGSVPADLSQEDYYITACAFAESAEDQALLQSLLRPQENQPTSPMEKKAEITPPSSLKETPSAAKTKKPALSKAEEAERLKQTQSEQELQKARMALLQVLAAILTSKKQEPSRRQPATQKPASSAPSAERKLLFCPACGKVNLFYPGVDTLVKCNTCGKVLFRAQEGQAAPENVQINCPRCRTPNAYMPGVDTYVKCTSCGHVLYRAPESKEKKAPPAAAKSYPINSYKKYLDCLEGYFLQTTNRKKVRLTQAQIEDFLKNNTLTSRFGITVQDVQEDLEKIYRKYGVQSQDPEGQTVVKGAEKVQINCPRCRTSNAYTPGVDTYVKCTSCGHVLYRAPENGEKKASPVTAKSYQIDSYEKYLAYLEAYFVRMTYTYTLRSKNRKKVRLTKEQIDDFVRNNALESRFGITALDVQIDLGKIYQKYGVL